MGRIHKQGDAAHVVVNFRESSGGVGVTTFSLLINAVVISTFLPVAVGAENFQGVLNGDGIMPQSQQARFHLANALLPSPLHDALFAMPATEQTPAPLPPLQSPPAFPRDLFSPLPDTSTYETIDPEENLAEQEERMRLARFLPKDNKYAGLLSSVDSIRAKALEARGSKSSEQEKMILAYQVGEDSLPAPDDRTEAEILLNSGFDQLQQQNLRGATTAFFDVVNRFPDSESSDLLDNAINAISWDAERGLVDMTEMRQFADSLPNYQECQSDKAVYWLIAAHQITGHTLNKAGQKEDANLYLGYARDAALAAMKDMPNSDYQIFIPGHYMLACRDLGKEALKDGIKQLKRTIRIQENNNFLKLASRMTLAVIHHRDFHDRFEAGVQCMNLIDEFSDSECATILETKTASPNVLGHIEFALGYTRFQLAQFGQARNHFSNVVKQHPENYRLAESAAYMVAYLTELIESDNPEVALDAYYNYITTYTDGANLEKAVLYMAGVFQRMGSMTAAADTYRYAVELSPNASWVKHAETMAQEIENAVLSGAETDILLQKVSAEYGGNLCGPYALALLLESQGKEADLSILAEAAGSDATGTSLSGLLNAATEAGLTVYAEKVDGIRTLSAPVIAHFTEGHYVFVSAIQTDKVILEDVSGERILSPAEFDALFSGYAITLRNLQDGNYISQEIMDSIRGGCELFFEDLNENYVFCINQDYIPPCPVETGAPADGGGAAGGMGSQPPMKYGAGGINIPGLMSDPGNPSAHPNISFSGMNIDLGTNHRAVAMSQTDLSVKNRSKMSFSFQRVYYNPWGNHEEYKSVETRPFKNNIGQGWIHNFNVHLRVSSDNSMVALADANSNLKRFVRQDPPNQNGYDIYRMQPVNHEEGNLDTLTHERAMVLKRSVANGWLELYYPDGMVCHFSAPIHDDERYCRLEWFEDTSGDRDGSTHDNQIDLTYADCILDTDDDQVPDTNFGRLSRVDAPEDDGRYFEFIYSGNRITDVNLCIGEGQEKEELQSVQYGYGGFKGTDSTYGLNFLRSVQMNNDSNDVIQFEYDDGEYDYGYPRGVETVGMYPSKITDKEDNELLIDFVEYENLGFICAREIEITYPNGLVTEISKGASINTIIKNYDDTTVLSKFWYVFGTYSVKIAYAYYYPDPNLSATNAWAYTYQNSHDLSTVAKISTQYWHDEDTGRAIKSARGGVYYRYEYETAGDLYPYRMYGPGQASDSYKGPMTEFVYDSSDRIIQIKPPNMGSNGINFTYDSYGQLTERENAAENSETFTYDAQGNMTSHTDFENNTTSYVYNDLGNVVEVIHPNSTQDPDTRTHYEYESGGCTCSGGSGQLTSITLPGGAEILFEYDNNGNMTKQTDPLLNETLYEYDSMGNLVKITTEELREQTYEYDLLGNMIASTDFEGKVTKHEYDYRGLMTKTWIENDPGTTADDDVLVENVYDDVGRLITVIDGKDQQINFVYNSLERLERTTHGTANSYFTQNTGPHFVNTYDSYGRLQKTVAKTDYFSSEYDPIEYTYSNTTGQLTQKKYTNYDPIDQQNIIQYVDYEYDLEGRMIIADDWFSRGMQTDGHEFAYDDNGRLLTYTDYDGAELNYTYDNMGRVAAMDAYETNNSYEYDYNVAGQLDTLTAPGSKEWAFTYDDAGRITSYTWPNGMSTHYTYDDDGRLTGIQHKDSTTVEEGWAYTLNEGGNIRHVANIADDTDDEAWEYYYDSRDRLVEALQRGEYSKPEACYVYAYDKADNMTSKIKYNAEVYNRFYDTDTYFPWMLVSGTWSLIEGAVGYEVSSGTHSIAAPHTAGDHEAWFSFKRVGYLNGMFDGFRVRLRNIDANNYLDVWWALGLTVVEECVNGTPTILTTLQNVGEEEGVWYDVYVQLEDDDVLMYVGIRGEEMVKVVDTTTSVTSSTDRIQIIVSSGLSEFHFDDIKVMTRELSDKTMAMTYGAGNQLTNIVRGDGVEIDLDYDAWGRVYHMEMDVPGVDTFTMDFVYECGDKLRRVETDVPGMPTETEFFTDGLGKRRYKLVPNDTLTCYRWDAGYNVLTEYVDDTGQWNAPDFTRFFVPKGHTAFAEGVPDEYGNPANGAYNYLAHDHLGTGRFAYNQAKAQIGTVEHDPYGERISQTGYTPYHEFTGKPFDSETGMYYFPYRYYHPHINRWTTPDPAGLVDGPNVYGYVGGNPVMNLDKLGLDWRRIIELLRDVANLNEQSRRDLILCLRESCGFDTTRLNNGEECPQEGWNMNDEGCLCACSCFHSAGMFRGDTRGYGACIAGCEPKRWMHSACGQTPDNNSNYFYDILLFAILLFVLTKKRWRIS